jgi:hypothetical protein
MKSVWLSVSCQDCKKELFTFLFTGQIGLSVQESVNLHVNKAHKT